MVKQLFTACFWIIHENDLIANVCVHPHAPVRHTQGHSLSFHLAFFRNRQHDWLYVCDFCACYATMENIYMEVC